MIRKILVHPGLYHQTPERPRASPVPGANIITGAIVREPLDDGWSVRVEPYVNVRA
jgi:hypothetical protein